MGMYRKLRKIHKEGWSIYVEGVANGQWSASAHKKIGPADLHLHFTGRSSREVVGLVSAGIQRYAHSDGLHVEGGFGED